MTRTLTPTVATVLLGAAELLRNNRWGRGQMACVAASGELVVCSVGAIATYVEGIESDPVVRDNLVTDAVNHLTRTIWKTVDGRPHVTAWNDRLCKSKQEAIDMLGRAASNSDSGKTAP